MNYQSDGKHFMLQALSLMLCLSLASSVRAEADLNWLQGNWCLTDDGQFIEEVWLSDVGGNLIGMSRTVVDGKVATFEFMRIETAAGVTRFIAYPGGGSGTEFVATRVQENELVVENPEHDFPQKITYRREGNKLTARISGPGDAGQEQSLSFNYQRCN